MAFLFASLSSLNGLVPPTVTRIAVLLLAIKAVRALYSAADFLSIYFLRPSRLHRYIYPDAEGHPPWALVTGASAGVGVAFADELAAAGVNVILHGRNAAKLERVRQRLAAQHPQRSFRIIVADATDVGRQNSAKHPIDSIVDSLKDLHVTILINNAGGALVDPVYAALADTPSGRIVDTVALNGLFPLVLTARMLGVFERRKTPALVMYIGSMAENGLPFLAPYGGAKALITASTPTLRREQEIREGGASPGQIQIMTVRFGVVTGVSHLQTPPSLFEPSANTMARAALARTGSGRDVVVGYFPHALQILMMDMMPGWLQERIFKQVTTDLRNEELKQIAAKEKAA